MNACKTHSNNNYCYYHYFHEIIIQSLLFTIEKFQVGEDNLSFGYGGTGKASVNNKFFNYGEPYTSGDIISCYIDLDANPGVVLYSKNGKYLGVAFHLDHSANGQTFFPHVTVKNMRLLVNFGQFQSYFHSVEGFCFLTRLPPN